MLALCNKVLIYLMNSTWSTISKVLSLLLVICWLLGRLDPAWALFLASPVIPKWFCIFFFPCKILSLFSVYAKIEETNEKDVHISSGTYEGSGELKGLDLDLVPSHTCFLTFIRRSGLASYSSQGKSNASSAFTVHTCFACLPCGKLLLLTTCS